MSAQEPTGLELGTCTVSDARPFETQNRYGWIADAQLCQCMNSFLHGSGAKLPKDDRLIWSGHTSLGMEQYEMAYLRNRPHLGLALPSHTRCHTIARRRLSLPVDAQLIACLAHYSSTPGQRQSVL